MGLEVGRGLAGSPPPPCGVTAWLLLHRPVDWGSRSCPLSPPLLEQSCKVARTRGSHQLQAGAPPRGEQVTLACAPSLRVLGSPLAGLRGGGCGRPAGGAWGGGGRDLSSGRSCLWHDPLPTDMVAPLECWRGLANFRPPRATAGPPGSPGEGGPYSGWCPTRSLREGKSPLAAA